MEHHSKFGKGKGIEFKKEFTSLEINGYKTARASFWVSVASMIIAVIFGAMGLRYMANSPDKNQIDTLLKKQNRLLTGR